MADALVRIMQDSGEKWEDMLIFLPSRRAVRTVEKDLVRRVGHAVMLPHLVALGEGVDDEEYVPEITGDDVISNTERVIVVAKLLVADANIGRLSVALPIARDLVRMQDYLENEGVDAADINGMELVDEKYAQHFQSKAQMLGILSQVMREYANGRQTSVQVRNAEIRNWINYLHKYKLVIVCGSTASVPATADLMVAIAAQPHGRIILSGKIDGRESDFALDTNPYNAEYKFLGRVGVKPADVIQIDVGQSAIDFMNYCMGNDTAPTQISNDLRHCHLVVCGREAQEAEAVAEIAERSIKDSKSVLVITPDAAGNQRIAVALAHRNIDADFSGGKSGAAIPAGRAILNLLDAWIEKSADEFNLAYVKCGRNLFDTIADIVERYHSQFTPKCVIDDADSVLVWHAIKDLSDALNVAVVDLDVADARALIADALSGVSVRGAMNDGAGVVVLGTIESRMQTADVVILTGLNDGMFPSRGYENSWLPRALAQQIGLPSPDRKVSLQALDFMNLSCGPEVYWVRSGASGGVQMTESRFLSRIIARGGDFDTAVGTDVIAKIVADDSPNLCPLSYAPPSPPADWSDVYVTELEHLIHNPYSFYVKHILRLKTKDDYWLTPDARDFGNLVHEVIEKATDYRTDVLIAQMDARAHEILGRGSILFHFWHKRFCEIAPLVEKVFGQMPDGAQAEIGASVKIPVGKNAERVVRARADWVWDGGVLDIKTGSAPSESQLKEGNMPQLPLEALMLKSGGFKIKITKISQLPIMQFLQLKNNDVRLIEYDAQTTQMMIDAAYNKTQELFQMYSAGGAEYENRPNSDQKYRNYDDLVRAYD